MSAHKHDCQVSARVLSANATGVVVVIGAWPWSVAWPDLRCAAVQADEALAAVYSAILSDARAICPPEPREWPCECASCESEPDPTHAATEWLDTDQVQREAESQARQRSLGAEIDDASDRGETCPRCGSSCSDGCERCDLRYRGEDGL